MSDTINILVVDDEETLADLISTSLRYEGYAVTVASDGPSALSLAQQTAPHLVILDWMLPGLDGLSVCRTLRARGDVSILMLTAKGELDDRVAGLESGADDYLVKPFKFKELLARVRAMLRRRNLQLAQRLRVGEIELDRETREVWRDGQLVELTPREFEVLDLLMAHPRQVFTREQMMNRIWGYDWVGDTNVVEVYISALREKLGDRERQRIQTVRGVGYTMRGGG